MKNRIHKAINDFANIFKENPFVKNLIRTSMYIIIFMIVFYLGTLVGSILQ